MPRLLGVLLGTEEGWPVCVHHIAYLSQQPPHPGSPTQTHCVPLVRVCHHFQHFNSPCFDFNPVLHGLGPARIILHFSNFSTCRHIPAFTHLTTHKRLWWLTLAFQARVTLVGLHSQNDSHLRTSLWFPRFVLAVVLLLPPPEFLSLAFHCPLLPDWPLLVLVTPMWAFLHNSQVTSLKAYNFWAS